MSAAHLWLRHETRATERRAPIGPPDARRLVEQGFRVTVEESPQRAFGLDGYAAAGCSTAPAGSWRDAPAESYVVGLKELPPAPQELVHRHIFFGHAYKGQEGADRLLRRFGAGGGALLDMEYLVDDGGRRLAAFGYWDAEFFDDLGIRCLGFSPLMLPSEPGLRGHASRCGRAGAGGGPEILGTSAGPPHRRLLARAFGAKV